MVGRFSPPPLLTVNLKSLGLVGAEDILDGIDQNVTETAYVLLALEEKALNLRGQLIGPVFQFCPVGICYGVTAG